MRRCEQAFLIAVATLSLVAVAATTTATYAAPADSRPVQPPNPSPPGSSLTKCPDETWTQVSRQECEKEPEMLCEQDDNAEMEGCQIRHEQDPVCNFDGGELMEVKRTCFDHAGGGISTTVPVCL